MNSQIGVGLVLNGVVAFSAFGAATVLGVIMSLFWVLSVFGVILLLGGARRKGAILVLIGCVPFVPIGLIGAMGARKILDELVRLEFEARRLAP